jgi:hypothetical protein
LTEDDLNNLIFLSSIPIKRIGDSNMPDGIASSCIIKFSGKHILLTVQHATGDMKNWCLELKYEKGKGVLVKPLGAMNFLATYNIKDGQSRDIDFSYVEIQNDLQPYWQKINANTEEVESEIPRIISVVDFDLTPSKDESYGFAGQVLPEFVGNALFAEHKLYTKLKYVGDDGDYYKFELPNAHPGHEHFQGCSGAPIIDSQGRTVALVCKGDLATNIVYGISLKRYQIALDATYGELSKIT